MKIKPLYDKVLILAFPPQDTVTAAGLYIPTAKDSDKERYGEVLAVGPGKVENGILTKPSLKVGDKVIFSQYIGVEIETPEGLWILTKDNDILGTVEDE